MRSCVLPLTPDQRLTLVRCFVCSMDVEEMETLWQYRHCLTDKTALLPRILQSKAVRGWDWASLPELKVLLDNWPLSNISQAVELLLPQSVKRFNCQTIVNLVKLFALGFSL